MQTVITNATILTLDDRQQTLETGFILIENDRIRAVARGRPEAETLERAGQVIDATHMLAMPGMVNAHTHLFQTFIRGLGDDLPLEEWLKRYIWPVAASMTLDEAMLAAKLGFIENIRSGATAVTDNQYIHNTPEMDDVFCQAAEELGVRFLMARGWTDRNYHPAFLETPDQIMVRLSALSSRWNQHPTGRIRVQPGPLSQTVVTAESVTRASRLAKEWGVGLHMHVSETRRETESCLRDTGLRPVEWLDSLGCLNAQTQLVHAVWLSDHEIDLIAASGAKVVHCPVSNMYLASGAARIPEMRQRGIPVALATDGPGSNNNQDMIETLKTTALLHKVTSMDARVFLPEDVLWMACRCGAQAFGQPELIGSLEVGKKADIVLVDLDTPFAVPVHRPVSALVYSLNGRSVDTVIVDGKILMKGKKILALDEQALLEECRVAAIHLLERANRSL